jgi:hypothetical protein
VQVVIGAFGKMQRLPRYDADDNVVPVSQSSVRRRVTQMRRCTGEHYERVLVG